jgi:hypothetical protein
MFTPSNLTQQIPSPKTVITIAPRVVVKDVIWQPQELDTVLYFQEQTQTWKRGIWLGLFNDLRNLRSENDSRENEHFESSPYHQECLDMVFRGRVLDTESGLADWEDIGFIIEPTFSNILWAHEQNMIIHEQQAIDRLAAFGAVQAVA